MNRCELAKSYFNEGYNCTQSVCLAFSDLVQIDKEPLLKIASSFGGGIGRLREVCGAFSGAVIILGLLYGYSDLETGEVKKEHYTRVQEIASKFKEEFHFLRCRELLNLDGPSSPIPSPRTNEFYKTRPCGDIVYYSVYLLEEYIKNNPIK